MLLVGQSLALHGPPLVAARARGDPAPLVEGARRQLAAGAHALDLNAGVEGSADGLTWAVRALREAGIAAPLWLDTGDVEALTTVLAALEGHDDLHDGPLVANALPAAVSPHPAEAALTDVLARTGAGVVLSPRSDSGQVDALVEAAARTLERLRAAGVAGPCYVDALAYPALSHPAEYRRSLALAPAYRRAFPEASPLAAVGNVAHGARGREASRLRVEYVRAAVDAGVGVLILPVEDDACVAAALGSAR